jgi:hypothetical protein
VRIYDEQIRVSLMLDNGVRSFLYAEALVPLASYRTVPKVEFSALIFWELESN